MKKIVFLSTLFLYFLCIPLHGMHTKKHILDTFALAKKEQRTSFFEFGKGNAALAQDAEITNDVKKIGARCNVKITNVYQCLEPQHHCGSFKSNKEHNSLGILKEDWKFGNRLKVILPVIAYNAAYLYLKKAKDNLKTDNLLMEKHVDLFAAAQTGTALEAARFYLRVARETNHLSINDLPGHYEPTPLVQAQALIKFYKMSHFTLDYLESRLWKLDFVLDSYKRHIAAWNKSNTCTSKEVNGVKRIPTTQLSDYLHIIREQKPEMVKNYFTVSKEDLSEIFSYMPQSDYMSFVSELRACVQVLRRHEKDKN